MTNNRLGVRMIGKMLAWIRKHLWCRFMHRSHCCYPDVQNGGLRGPWHCDLCHPCGEGLES